MSFRDLKVGDYVNRQMGANIKFMEMVVVRVNDQHLWCAPHPHNVTITPEEIAKFEAAPQEAVDNLWKFDRDEGCEEDEDLGWGKAHGVTGTYLVKQE